MKLSYPIDVSSMSPFTIDNLPYGIFSTAEDVRSHLSMHFSMLEDY